MAIPKKLHGKIALLALKHADSMLEDDGDGKDAEDSMDEEADAAEAELCCPQCNHKGPSEDFKE